MSHPIPGFDQLTTEPSRMILGFDIGGANLKISDGISWSRHEPFELWKKPEQLRQKLCDLVDEFLSERNNPNALWTAAVTMTGELTDCFANKKEGVVFIVDAVQQAFPSAPCQFYLTNGSFVDATTAKQEYEMAAASNWMALAQFISGQTDHCNRDGLLIDIGSTTTDIIPFSKGQVIAKGKIDFDRLCNKELIYTGSIRSHIPGIILSVIHRNVDCPLMNELFGTTLDTNIVLGHFEPGSNSHYSADGKPTQMEDCVRRLSRFLGKDELTFDLTDAIQFSHQVFDAQVKVIGDAAMSVINEQGLKNLVVVGSGQGDFYVDAVAHRLKDELKEKLKLTQLADSIGESGTSCATAYAIAHLARQNAVPLKDWTGEKQSLT